MLGRLAVRVFKALNCLQAGILLESVTWISGDLDKSLSRHLACVVNTTRTQDFGLMALSILRQRYGMFTVLLRTVVRWFVACISQGSVGLASKRTPPL